MFTNVINKEIVEFTCNDEDFARRIQVKLEAYTLPRFSEIISSVLSDGTYLQHFLKIDTLEIDLGDIHSHEFDNGQVLSIFRQQFEKKMDEIRNQNTINIRSNNGVVPHFQNEIDVIRTFLSSGDVPWWLDKSGHVSIDFIILKLLNRYPDVLQKLLEENRENPANVLRLYVQLKPATRSKIQAQIPAFSNEVLKEQFVGKSIGLGIGIIPSRYINRVKRLFSKHAANESEKLRSELTAMLLQLDRLAQIDKWNIEASNLHRFLQQSGLVQLLISTESHSAAKSRKKKNSIAFAVQALTVFEAELLLFELSQFFDTAQLSANAIQDAILNDDKDRSSLSSPDKKIIETVSDIQNFASTNVVNDKAQASDEQSENTKRNDQIRNETGIIQTFSSIQLNNLSEGREEQRKHNRPNTEDLDHGDTAIPVDNNGENKNISEQRTSIETNEASQSGDNNVEIFAQREHKAIARDKNINITPESKPESGNKLSDQHQNKTKSQALSGIDDNGKQQPNSKAEGNRQWSEMNDAARSEDDNTGMDAELQDSGSVEYKNLNILHKTAAKDSDFSNQPPNKTANNSTPENSVDTSKQQPDFNGGSNQPPATSSKDATDHLQSEETQQSQAGHSISEQGLMKTGKDAAVVHKMIHIIMKKLKTTDASLLEYLQQLTKERLAQLVQLFKNRARENREFKQTINHLLEQLSSDQHNILKLFTQLSSSIDQSSKPRSPSAENNLLLKAAGKKVQPEKTSITALIKQLPSKDFLIVNKILQRGCFATENEKRVIRRILLKLSHPNIRLLQFLTELPEQEIKKLTLLTDHPVTTAPVANNSNITFFTQAEEKNVHIENAGLCLLAIYLPRFLKQLNYLENGKFKNIHFAIRAVYLLEYIVSGKKKPVEYVLQFNKLLCGFKTEDQVITAIRLTKKEMEEADNLVQAVINNWISLKNTSVQGFRSSFLNRKGILSEAGNAWLLRVEKKGFDVLLDTLPWSFNIIKLPWMAKMIQVEW